MSSNNDWVGWAIVLGTIVYFWYAALLGFDPALWLLGLLFKGLILAGLAVIPLFIIALLARHR